MKHDDSDQSFEDEAAPSFTHGSSRGDEVVERILHNMSVLFERTFSSVQDLNRYRKEIAARLAAAGVPQSA